MRIESIRTKMFLIFSAFILILFLLGTLAVHFFLDDYYRDKQIDKVRIQTERVEAFMEANDRTSAEDVLQEAADTLGVRGYLLEGEQVVYATSTQGFGKGQGRGAGKSLNSGSGAEALILPGGVEGNTDWILYSQQISEDYSVVFQIPMRAIDEAMGTVRDFFVVLLLVGLVFALAFSLYFSKRITDPIKRLEQVAESVRNLNFSVRYDEDRRDEIGKLGRTVNEMATRLEETIEALKGELKKEKSLDHMRKQFVAQVSHELKTPLSVIKGYAEALSDDFAKNPDDRRFYYAVINEEADRMNKMILELLDLSQLESGTFGIEKKIVDLRPELEELNRKYALMGEATGRLIEFDCAESSLMVQGDRARLMQVLENFMANAWNYGDKDGRIRLSAKRVEDAFEIKVFNSGRPIDEKELPHIWDSFYKIDENSSGTGLGLSISRSILNKHQAPFFARNEEEGVSFGFRLKRA